MMHDNEQVYDRIVFDVQDVTDDYVSIKGYANKYLDDNGEVVVDTDASAILPVSYTFTRLKKNPLLLFNHSWDRPIGNIQAVEMRENGLYIEAKVYKDIDPSVYNMVRLGVVKTFSVGFITRDSYYDERSGLEIITHADLWEVSLAPIPSNADSEVLRVSDCNGDKCVAIRSANTQKMDLRAQVEQIVRKKLEI